MHTRRVRGSWRASGSAGCILIESGRFARPWRGVSGEGRRAEDGGGRDAGSACRTPRMRQVRLKADSIRPRPADAVGAHKSGLVRRAGDGFAGFGEERKAALRALGGAYRVKAAVQRTETEEKRGGLAHPPGGGSWRDKASGSAGDALIESGCFARSWQGVSGEGRRAEDGDGRDAGSACRTPRMRQVRLKADSIRPCPADAVGAHKSGLVRRAGDGFAGFGEERKAALRVGGAYRMSGRRAEDGGGREAGRLGTPAG